MVDEPPNNISEHRKWLLDTRRRDAERVHDEFRENRKRRGENTAASGQLAIRTAVLINGGAAVAVLAFIGGLIGQGRIEVAKVNDIASSLMWFAFGVALAGASMGATYFGNFAASIYMTHHSPIWEHPFLREEPKARRWMRFAQMWQVLAIVFGLASLAFFIIGMFDVRLAVGRLR